MTRVKRAKKKSSLKQRSTSKKRKTDKSIRLGTPSGKVRRSDSKKRRVTQAIPISMRQWLRQVRDLHEQVHPKELEAGIGACLVTNAHTGQPYCILTNAHACATLKGTFMGGSCG